MKDSCNRSPGNEQEGAMTNQSLIPDSSTIACCPSCGEPLSEDAPKGLCGSCLMMAALAGAESQPTANKKASVPNVDTIRQAFPQYEVLELIGSGGMGAVYKARQPQLDRMVALKLLTAQDGDERFAQRFQQEAQTLARLSHPNIVTIYDYGETNGYYYLLMEYVEGLNLRQIMGAGHLAPDQALAIVPHVCEALDYAHSHGVVHRDVKPENILMDHEGRVKIADFGIARLMGNPVAVAPEEENARTEFSLTNEQILGTPNYMAPEQSTTPNAVDHRADIYALGVVFYEMLTGHRPEPESFTPPSQKVAIDVRLDEIVLRALSQDPEQRYQRITEFRTQLQTVAVEGAAPETNEVAETPPAPIDPPPVEGVPKSTLRRTLITLGSIVTAIFAIAFFHSFLELLLMFGIGILAFQWVKNIRISPLSAFSKTSRVCLSMAAIPALFSIATLVGQLLPGLNSSSSPRSNEPKPPEVRRLDFQGHTLITADDGLRTHYVFHYPGEITTVGGMSIGGPAHATEWSRDGLLHLPSDQRITYERESSDLATLFIDGNPWDLREGALFQVFPNGKIEQRPVYPPLLREKNLAEWMHQMDF